jgi:hypothetical protein
MLTQQSREKVQRVNKLPAIDDAMCLLGFGGNTVSEMDCELTDISKRELVGCLLIKPV